MSTDHQLRDQLVAAAAQPHYPPDLDGISHRAQRRRARRRTTLLGGTGILAVGAAAVVLALPSSITGPTIDEQQPPPIALLADTSDVAPSDGSILDRLNIEHDPGRARTIEHGDHIFVVATSHGGSQTCMYANPAASELWTGGCKPTSAFLNDGWLLLTIRTDDDPTTFTAILTRDDVTNIRTPTGRLDPEHNLTVTTRPLEGLNVEARQPTAPLPRSVTLEVGTMVR